jgi:hypothetical protein
MNLCFASPSLEDTANSSSQMEKLFGDEAHRIKQRLCELASAQNLEMLATVPALQLSPTADRKAFTVRVSAARVILFEPAANFRHHDKNRIDLSSVISIRILSLSKNHAS